MSSTQRRQIPLFSFWIRVQGTPLMLMMLWTLIAWMGVMAVSGLPEETAHGKEGRSRWMVNSSRWMVNSRGQSKGLRSVLEESGVDTSEDQAWHDKDLSEMHDLVSKTTVEDLVKIFGHQWFFLTSHHYSLNPIEFGGTVRKFANTLFLCAYIWHHDMTTEGVPTIHMFSEHAIMAAIFWKFNCQE